MFTSIFLSTRWGIGVGEEESIRLIHLCTQGRRMQFKSDLALKTSSRKHLCVQGVTVYYSPWHHPFQKLVLTVCFLYLNWISSFLYTRRTKRPSDDFQKSNEILFIPFWCLIWHLSKSDDISWPSTEKAPLSGANWATNGSTYRLGEQ